MSSPAGLIECGSDWGSAFCIVKSLQTAMSLGLIIWIIIEMVNYYHYVRVIKSSFILVVEILMLMTLTCTLFNKKVNIAFSVYHTTYALLYIQIYFNNMYFLILCYYLIFNVFKRIKWMRASIACFVGFFSLIFLLILIDSFIQNVKTCKQLSYLVMNSLGIIISIIMFSAYRYNEIIQKKRIDRLNRMLASQQIQIKDNQNEQFLKMKIPSKVNFNMPFTNIWFMIICNILAQVIGLGQSIAFQLDWARSQSSNVCYISQNPTINSVVNFIFVILTLYLSFVSTILVFRKKRKTKDQFHARIKSPSDFSSVQSGKHTLQMVAKDSFSLVHADSNAVDNLSQLYQKYQNQRRYNRSLEEE